MQNSVLFAHLHEYAVKLIFYATVLLIVLLIIWYFSLTITYIVEGISQRIASLVIFDRGDPVPLRMNFLVH